jgi:branched-subunit amino acid aminotransferase/4-amino-4-deoxychorismate lyase
VLVKVHNISKKMWYYFDNCWVEAPCISPEDRAFQYGDGLFETIIVREGRVLFAQDHYARLQRGASALGLALPDFVPTCPQAFAHWLQAIVEAWGRLSGGSLPSCVRLKLILWRRAGGLYRAMQTEAHCLVSLRPQERLYQGDAVRLAVYDAYRLQPHPLSQVKCLQALPYVLAARHAARQGFDDALLIDTRGYVAEATSANVFWVEEGVFCTPPLDTGCVEGIMRLQWLRYLKAQGMECRQLYRLPQQLTTYAEGMWLVNVGGVRRVQEVNGHCLNQSNEIQGFVMEMQAAIWGAAMQSA